MATNPKIITHRNTLTTLMVLLTPFDDQRCPDRVQAAVDFWCLALGTALQCVCFQ